MNALRVGAAVSVFLFAVAVQAQEPLAAARVASVTGPALLSTSQSRAAIALTRGYLLNPGDRVDTRGGGRVVIDLSDGSLVIVHPETMLVIKDFRAAASARELFEITVGAVRVKIHHITGKPNPYRMNSPTASIAVRGTEFDVTVAPEGETNVDVLEGAVEVSELANPENRTLIEAGHGVLVRPGAPMQLYTARIGRNTPRGRGIVIDRVAHAPAPPPPGVTTDAKAAGIVQRPGTGAPMVWANMSPGMAVPPEPAPLPAPGIRPAEGDGRVARTFTQIGGAGVFDPNLSSLVELGQAPYQLRFNAFSDLHSDSLENPAAASRFQQGEMRLLFMPTRTQSGDGSPEYGIAPQVSVFQPLWQGRAVVGGSYSAARVASGTATLVPALTMQSSNATTSALSAFHVVASVKLGASGRNSVGAGVERLGGIGSFLSESAISGVGSLARFSTEARSVHTRFTAGWNRRLANGGDAGVFARIGTLRASSGEISSRFLGQSAEIQPESASGDSREIGFRVRAPLTRRLYYGVSGTISMLRLEDDAAPGFALPLQRRENARRSFATFGVGYVANSRTLLNLDVSGGSARVESSQYRWRDTRESALGSVHAAVHRDVTRRLFTTISVLGIWRADDEAAPLPLHFSAVGSIRDVRLLGSLLPFSCYAMSTLTSEVGGGWRLSPDVSVQYLHSRYYGVGSAHTLLLRFDKKARRE